MYIANAFIGTDYTPGEILPDGLDEALIDRLLKAGAIHEVAPEPVTVLTPVCANEKAKAEEEQREDTRKNYYAQLDAMGFGPDGHPKADAEGGTAEEDYEEPEAPEIDVTAALVDEEETEPKAAPRRKGGKAK